MDLNKETGVKLNNHIIHSLKVKSLIKCAVKCSSMDRCISVNYNTFTTVCELNDLATVHVDDESFDMNMTPENMYLRVK